MAKKKLRPIKNAISLVIIAIIFGIAHLILLFNSSKFNLVVEYSFYYTLFIVLLIIIFLLSLFYLLESNRKFYRILVFLIMILLLFFWLMMDLIAFSRGYIFAGF